MRENYSNLIYEEPISRRNKFEPYIEIVFFGVILAVLFFYSAMLLRATIYGEDKYVKLSGQAWLGNVIIIGILGVLCIYTYRRTKRSFSISQPLVVYENGFLLPHALRRRFIPKKDVESIYIMDWSLPRLLKKYTPKEGIKGIGIKLKNGRFYKGPARNPIELGKLIEEIKKHWGEQYIGGELSKEI